MQIGIIGAGGATRGIHLPGFELVTDAEVAVLCDADHDAARATGVRETCTDYQEVLARRNLDAVVVATPNFLHRDIVLADIGSHLVHITQYLAGDIRALTAAERRFRDDPASDVEDWIAFLAEFANGATGTFEISRVAPGRGAGISEDIFIELYGTKGSIVFSLQDPWGLMVALGEDGLDPARPLRHYDVPRELLKIGGSPRDVMAHDRRWGYRYDQAFQFVESVKRGQARAPSFADGLRCQAVLDAVLESARERRWVEVV